MRRVLLLVIWLSVALAFPLGNLAQAQAQTLGSTMDVYVFPAEGQDSGQQSQDEAACYEWAVGNTGSDPFDLAKQEQSDAQQAQAEAQAAEQVGQGSGARSAVRGAAWCVVAVRAERQKRKRKRRRQIKPSIARRQQGSNSPISRKRSVCASRPKSTWSSTDLTILKIRRRT